MLLVPVECTNHSAHVSFNPRTLFFIMTPAATIATAAAPNAYAHQYDIAEPLVFVFPLPLTSFSPALSVSSSSVPSTAAALAVHIAHVGCSGL